MPTDNRGDVRHFMPGNEVVLQLGPVCIETAARQAWRRIVEKLTDIRGGAYNCSDSVTYHRCDYIPTTWTPSAKGFRCCVFSPAALPEWAVAAGIDRAAFERAFADPKTRDELIACKQEGLRNKVTATPGIFIDGRPYLYDMNMEALLDVLEEAHDAAIAARR